MKRIRHYETEAPASATLTGDLKAWENSFRIAIDTIPGLAWFGKADGPVEFLNRQWCEYTGIEMRKALGWGWVETIHPEDLPGLEAHWRTALELGVAGEVEARVRRSDGAYHWFLFRYAPLLDEVGNVLKWYGCNIDIEARKRAEAAMLASEQLARGHVNALKSALDILAIEPDPDRLVAHIVRTLTEQMDADSASLWRSRADGLLSLDFAFEDGALISNADERLTWVDRLVSTDELWHGPEASRFGHPIVVRDIRRAPRFPLKDWLLRRGVVTALFLPMSVAGRLEGAVGLGFRGERSFEAGNLGLAQALVNQAMLMIRLAELSARGREAAVVGERNRIARDIHDTLAQGFTGIIVQLEAAEDASRQGLGREAEQHVSSARKLARESLREARRSVQAMRPQPLEERGITSALGAMFAKLTEGAALRTQVRVTGDVRSLPPEWEQNLFRIAQEVLTNVLRHAHASRLTAAIKFDATSLLFDFVDNGRGFDPAATYEGFGLLGMRERVDAMGGELRISSSKGRGATVSIRLPWHGEKS